MATDILAIQQSANKEILKNFTPYERYNDKIIYVENKVSNSLELYNLLKNIFTKVTELNFVPREQISRNFNKDIQFDNPFVSYRLKERIITPDRKSRGTILHESETSTTYNESYEMLIQFDIFANDFETSELVLNEVESTILKYQSVFLQYGVERFMFEKQEEDESLDKFRDDASIRSVIFKVKIQRSVVQLHQTIEEIVFNPIVTKE